MISLPSFLLRLAASQVNKQLVNFNLSRPVVSFTFDDFPKTALSNGGEILESHQLSGTYYTSYQLCDTEGVSGMNMSKEDISSCIARGHELACHTYEHMNCLSYSSSEIAKSLEKNRELIQLNSPSRFRHFAYPYGRVGPSAKKIAMQYYQSARTTLPGVNRGLIDLGMLKACPLYSRFGVDGWQPYLRHLNKKSGWLIFYTHDVSETPSNYGCTPIELDNVIAQVLELGYDISSVGEVIDRLETV